MPRASSAPPLPPALALALALACACYAGAGESDGEAASEASSTAAITSTASTSTSTSTSGATATSTSTSTSTATSDGLTSSGEPDTSTGEPEPEPEPEPAPAIHYVGRHDASDPGHVVMGWSGVGLVARFKGSGASVDLDDKGRYFTVLVDGALQPTLATQGGPQTYVLAEGLPPGEHTVELYRRTEGSFGRTVILGVTIDGELLAPPPVTRRIEVIGDSISAGYGNEGQDPCNFSAETENHYRTYGAIAARQLGAELHTIAWSGKGLVYNYGDDVFEPMPAIYDRLVAVDAAPWAVSWQPDAVVINLGTNDFSTDNDPPEGLFVPAYVDFLAHLRERYPDALLLPIAPSLFGGDQTKAKGYIEAAVALRQEAGDAALAFADVNVQWLGVGCDGHPDAATHAAMGDKLAAELKARLGW